MLSHSTTLVLSLFATVAFSSPIASNAPRNVKIQGRRTAGQNELYKRADGSFNVDFAKSEVTKLHIKYGEKKSVKKMAKSKKRASGSVALTDVISGGLDEEYYGTIGLGSNNQQVQVDFDTGSSDLWVPGLLNLCFSTSYNPLTSTTFHQTLTPFEITYGSGAVVGSVCTDSVTVAGLTVPTQYFGKVNLCSPQFVGSAAGGIFGLGFSSIAQTMQPTVVENLISSGQLTNELFAFYLARNSVTGAELSIGATDPAHYSGSISYTPVISQTYWLVQAQDFFVNGAAVNGGAFGSAIDTGTTLIYVPTAVASALYAAVPGASADTADSATGGASYYQYPCSSSFSLAIEFAGISEPLSINLADFNLGTATGSSTDCVGGIIGMDFAGPLGSNIAIVGDEFLKSWYSVYNYQGAGGSPAVGFAASVA